MADNSIGKEDGLLSILQTRQVDCFPTFKGIGRNRDIVDEVLIRQRILVLVAGFAVSEGHVSASLHASPKSRFDLGLALRPCECVCAKIPPILLSVFWP